MLQLEIIIILGVTVVSAVLLIWLMLEDRRIDRENAERKVRFEQALERIFKAETLEEKVFRSDPDNDGKPFDKGDTPS